MKNKVLTRTQLEVFNICKLAMLEAQANNYKVLSYEELKKECVNRGLKSFDSSFNAIYLKGYVFRYPDIRLSDGYLLSKEYSF